MKLFQRLLVAPAAIGLFAPMAVNATEMNFSEVSEYSAGSLEVQSFSDVYPTDWSFQALTKFADSHNCNVAIPNETISRYEAAALLNKCLGSISSELNKEERRLIDEFSAELAVLQGRIDEFNNLGEFEAGQFSSTTTLSGSAAFMVGSVSDGGTDDTKDATTFNYSYALALDTSFTGPDTLHIEIETGNTGAADPLASMDSAVVGSNDELTVSKLFYATPAFESFEVTVGPKIAQDDVIAATGSLYSDAYRIGSMPFSAAGDDEGPGVALSYANDSGFVASASYISVDGGNSAKGIGTDKGSDVATFSAGYNGDGFGVGLVTAANDGDNGDGFDTFGGGVYWTPESIPATFSITYDSKYPEGTTADRSDLFFGAELEAGPGTLGFAYSSTDVDGSDSLDQIGYEVVYAYPVNDYITITPGMFFIEETTSNKKDDTGVFVETMFSF